MEIIKRIDAARQGLTFYFSGSTCKRGHRTQRYTRTGHCKTCVAMDGKEKWHKIKSLMDEAKERGQDVQT